VFSPRNNGGVPGPIKEPIQMDLNNHMLKKTVAKIIYWLTHSEYVGNATINNFLHQQVVVQIGLI
jgi:hypothetical protein